MFAIQFPVHRASGLLRQADTLEIDTVRLADEFRVDPVDVEGVIIDGPTGDAVDVSILFSQNAFNARVIDDASDALRSHMTGGSVAPHPPVVITDPNGSADAVKDRTLSVGW